MHFYRILGILSLIKLAQPVLWSNWCTLPCCFSVPSAEYNYIDMYMYVHVPALHMYMYVLLVRRVCTCLCMYHAGIIVICKHNRPPIRPQRCQPSSTHPPTTVVHPSAHNRRLCRYCAAGTVIFSCNDTYLPSLSPSF